MAHFVVSSLTTAYRDRTPTALPGFCRKTQDNDDSDCDADDNGSWSILNATSWSQLRAECVRRCKLCRQCKYISYSLTYHDCSWYTDCNLDKLQTKGVPTMDMRTEMMVDNVAAGVTLARSGSRKLRPSQLLPTLEWAQMLAAAVARRRPRLSPPLLMQIGANDHSQDADGGDVAPQLLALGGVGGRGRGGWRGVLVEPMPATFERLQERYRAHDGVRCVRAISAALCRKRRSEGVEFWGIDVSNATGLWGSLHADARCALGDAEAGYVTELSSLAKAHVLFQLGALDTPPLSTRVCARCATKLGRAELANSHCLRSIDEALRRVYVPCLDWQQALQSEPAIHLLLIDAEGFDDEVLDHFPFSSMGSQYGPHGGRSGLGVGSRVIADEAHGYAAVFRPIPLPWRVVFEAARMTRERFARAAARLRSAGYRSISGGYGSMQSVWHLLNSSETTILGQ